MRAREKGPGASYTLQEHIPRPWLPLPTSYHVKIHYFPAAVNPDLALSTKAFIFLLWLLFEVYIDC